jgi:hypothetical protein
MYAAQEYERGIMHWRPAQTGPHAIYVLDIESPQSGGTDWNGRDDGVWQRYDDRWHAALPVLPAASAGVTRKEAGISRTMMRTMTPTMTPMTTRTTTARAITDTGTIPTGTMRAIPAPAVAPVAAAEAVVAVMAAVIRPVSSVAGL